MKGAKIKKIGDTPVYQKPSGVWFNKYEADVYKLWERFRMSGSTCSMDEFCTRLLLEEGDVFSETEKETATEYLKRVAKL